jgi:hypothetical protein
MKRVAISLFLTLVLLGGYSLAATALRPYFLFSPGPFTFGKLAANYFVPRQPTTASEKVDFRNENKAVLVFLSVSFVSVAFPIYLLLCLAHASRRSQFRLR